MKTLIEESICGNELAYAELIESIKLDLYKIAKNRLKNPDDIDDVFQETIIKSYKNLDKLKNHNFFKTWIIRILINECNNTNYKYTKNTQLFNRIVNKVEFEQSIYTTHDIDNSIFMDELFSKLTDSEKEIAYLYFRDNFTSEKIAKLLNSNKNTVKSKIYRIRQKLQKLAMLIIILCIITTTTVFAIKFIVSLFTTSLQAIDTAVENNYVQNVDMNFTYDKNIGIKVDYILIDNKNLNISYIYDCSSYKDITSVRLEDYSISDEYGNMIYSTNSTTLTKISDNYGKQIILEDGHFRNSNLYVAKKYFPISSKLIFKINKISILSSNKSKEVSGTWNFEINLEDKFLNRTSEYYVASYSEYIENICTTLDKTSLIIDVELNTTPNTDLLFKYNNICLYNEKQNYNRTYYECNNNTIHMVFDVGQYTQDINNLNLYIKFDESKWIDINLIK